MLIKIYKQNYLMNLQHNANLNSHTNNCPSNLIKPIHQNRPESESPGLECHANSAYKSTAHSVFNSMINMSLTEHQILSHGLIKEVVEKSLKKTVQHQINMIPVDTQLYKVPESEEKGECELDWDVLKQKGYYPTGSQKIREMGGRLANSKDIGRRLSEIADKNREKLRQSATKTRPASANNNLNARVSVSGMISYNFNSVKARRSLSKIPDDPEQVTLNKRISEVRKRNSCMGDRNSRILYRKSFKQTRQQADLSNAAVCDFYMPTDKLLRVLRKQNSKEDMIFHDRMQKLNCIKQYMQKEGVQYDQAKFIIEAIIASQAKPKKHKRKHNSFVLDDDVELQNRKKVLQKKRVILRHLNFTD